MARRPLIDRDELGRLVRDGWTESAIAGHFGVSVSGVRQAKRQAGLTRPQRDHSRAIPWKVLPEHIQSGPATNLRALSTIIQGAAVPSTKRNTALRWARQLVDQGLDIAYDRRRGFHTIAAAGESSHIGDLLAAVPDIEDESARDA